MSVNIRGVVDEDLYMFTLSFGENRIIQFTYCKPSDVIEINKKKVRKCTFTYTQ